MTHLRQILTSSLAGMLAACCSLTLGAQAVIFPQQQQPGEARVDINPTGEITLSNDVITASYAARGGKVTFGGSPQLGLDPGTEIFGIVLQADTTRVIYASEMSLKKWQVVDMAANPSATVGSEKLSGKAVRAAFAYGDLEIQWQAVLRDGSHYLRTELELRADADVAMHAVLPMIYRGHPVDGVTLPGVVGNTRGSMIASPYLFAGIETPTGINTVEQPDASTFELKGEWSRHTTLQKGADWEIGSVVGLVAPGQQRRSVLAYVERERAVPWRTMNIYNSWYELNIDRNNSPTYHNHMTEADCDRIELHWKDKLFNENGAAIDAFVWDDGWDSYGTWTFNPNFPDGFRSADSIAQTMGAGIGAWLGPVGGYGDSGEMRRGYWRDKGGMQLSNPAYYKVFLDACENMIRNYDFRFFKLDGISAQGIAIGPDPGHRGEENAEGIINIERQVRKMRPDMFFNTTVGTWASPFWFIFSDAVWRQEADWSAIGDQGDDRERWITYRDHMVYDKFVTDAPLTPINMLMTHGVILTKKGNVSKTMDYDGIVREIRCAYACGSGMVELYTDYELLDSINGGRLWSDIAECIKWQRKNADVLPDAHWVGGNPWDGSKANVYGWASWNGKKATLALRNPSTEEATYTTTLRKALDIPAYFTSPVTLTKAFADQASLAGLPTGRPIGLDEEITVKMPGSTVYVFDGEH